MLNAIKTATNTNFDPQILRNEVNENNEDLLCDLVSLLDGTGHYVEQGTDLLLLVDIDTESILTRMNSSNRLLRGDVPSQLVFQVATTSLFPNSTTLGSTTQTEQLSPIPWNLYRRAFPYVLDGDIVRSDKTVKDFPQLAPPESPRKKTKVVEVDQSLLPPGPAPKTPPMEPTPTSSSSSSYTDTCHGSSSITTVTNSSSYHAYQLPSTSTTWQYPASNNPSTPYWPPMQASGFYANITSTTDYSGHPINVQQAWVNIVESGGKTYFKVPLAMDGSQGMGLFIEKIFPFTV